MGLDPFYLIVPDAKVLNALVPLGVRLVQLRLKSDDTAEVRQQVATSQALCARHGAQLVVNDHWQVAIDLGADAVHLGQEDLDGAGARPDAAIGHVQLVVRAGDVSHRFPVRILHPVHAQFHQGAAVRPDRGRPC